MSSSKAHETPFVAKGMGAYRQILPKREEIIQ
jgi:hypothetical protein